MSKILMVSFLFIMTAFANVNARELKSEQGKIKIELSELIDTANDWLLTKREEHLRELNYLRKEQWGQTVYQQPSVAKLRQRAQEDFKQDVEKYFKYFNEIITSIISPIQPYSFSEIEWLEDEYGDYLDFQAKCAVEVQRIKGE